MPALVDRRLSGPWGQLERQTPERDLTLPDSKLTRQPLLQPLRKGSAIVARVGQVAHARASYRSEKRASPTAPALCDSVDVSSARLLEHGAMNSVLPQR